MTLISTASPGGRHIHLSIRQSGSKPLWLPALHRSTTTCPCGMYGVHCGATSCLAPEGPRACEVRQERVSLFPRGWRDHTFLGHGACQWASTKTFWVTEHSSSKPALQPSSADWVFLPVFAQRFLVRLQPNQHNGEGAEPKLPSPCNSSG